MTSNTEIYLLLLSFLILFAGCSETTREQNDTQADTTTTKAAFNKNYANANYDIKLRYPESWILVEEPNLEMSKFAINVFRRGTGTEKELPLNVHAQAKHTYVAIWPHGLGTELPAGQYTSLDELSKSPKLSFSVNQKESKALILKNGTPWAYFIIPENPPVAWSDFGFIYVQVAVKNASATCFDEQTGNKIPMKKCDFLEGDQVIRRGNIDEQDAKSVRQILESISLQNVKKKVWAGDLIKVEQPLPNTTVTSPLTLKGKARGSWYFEGIFTVRLYDAYGNLLAEEPAKAQDNWMTEELVPFEVTLEFEAPDDQRGKLVFVKANPSGLKKNAMSYSVPVIFQPK